MEKDFQLTTANGYDFYEVSSAFQKCIRRGMEEDAVYWGLELYEGNFHLYAWKRMMIMAVEDVGLANPDLVGQLLSLKQADEWLQKNDTKGRGNPSSLHFMQAVLLLVRSPKSRLIDEAMFYYARLRQDISQRKEIPDFAFDKHTMKGKQMGRGFKHFFEEGAHIENEAEVAMHKEYYAGCLQYFKLNPAEFVSQAKLELNE